MSDKLSSDPSAPTANAQALTRVADAAPLSQVNPTSRSRKRALGFIAVAVLLGAAGYTAYWALALNHNEATDNAYVQGNLVQITAQVPGTVVAILADEADTVKSGQTLLKLDPADAQVALDQAEAQLAQTVREVRTLFANNATFTAQMAVRQADLVRSQSEVQRAQDDLSRRTPLRASGAVSQEEIAHATAQLSTARSAQAAALAGVQAAQETLTSNQSLTDGTNLAQHPGVQRAAARVREAYLALHRAELPAPLDGTVARRSVQIGQRVAPGTPLMTLVALDQLWVDANFKEAQLKSLRLGQPAVLTADVYGKKLEFHGKVSGLGAGTGAAFSLLPAQNATGNWIKVVQRVPVRISLDPRELAAHPLRLGLSMEVTVDVSQADGLVLAGAPRQNPVAQTAVFDRLAHAADAEVARVVLANQGSRTAAATRAPAALPGKP